jgi:transposase
MPKRKKPNAASISAPQESAAQLINTVRRQTQTRYGAEDKIRIVLEGLRGDHPVAELCRREDVSANVYYNWLKEFMEAGKARLKGEADHLRKENEALRQAVADLTVEARALKKSLF